jgi:hypothetical protein
MVLLEDVIKDEILAKFDNKIKVKEVISVNNLTSHVKFCDFKYLAIYQNKQFDEYQIGEFNEDGSIDITFITPLSIGSEIPLPIPLFFSGTQYVTVEEWHNFAKETSNTEESKLPFIWLVTPYNQRFMGEYKTINYKNDCRVLFVHWSNWSGLNQERLENAIEPLRALAKSFVHTIIKNKAAFGKPESYTTRNHPRLGKESNQGIDQTIFQSTLAAVELKISIDLKNIVCNC